MSDVGKDPKEAYDRKQAKKERSEQIFKYGSLVGILMFSYYMSLAHQGTVLVYEHRPEGYEPPMFGHSSTFTVPAATAACFFVLKKLVWPVFAPIFMPHCKD